MERKSEMACGCVRIEQANLEQASKWLLQNIAGHADVEMSIILGGDRCSFYREKKNPRGVEVLESKGRSIDE